jgi:hypothetical protein
MSTSQVIFTCLITLYLPPKTQMISQYDLLSPLKKTLQYQSSVLLLQTLSSSLESILQESLETGCDWSVSKVGLIRRIYQHKLLET